MTYTFDQSKDEIARLVKHFTANRIAYQAPGYKEAQARQEFIDPLFIALNWDVHNRQQAAPDYREVIVEDSLAMVGQGDVGSRITFSGRGVFRALIPDLIGMDEPAP
jgi:hypothetical protein